MLVLKLPGCLFLAHAEKHKPVSLSRQGSDKAAETIQFRGRKLDLIESLIGLETDLDKYNIINPLQTPGSQTMKRLMSGTEGRWCWMAS